MAVRPIDANAMLNELRPVSFEAEHNAVLLSDVSKMMREWVERQPTLTTSNEPLTLEQLQEIDSIPIWVVDTTINRREWCYWKDGRAYLCEDHPEYYDPDEYGLWLAYRRPLDGEENA